MSSSHASPLHRVKEVLQRMQGTVDDPATLKTYMGVLAILSRDEANKLLIARDGIRLILSVMELHMDFVSLQEAACDLLWSLAFNNNLVKEVIGRYGGIPVIITGMKSHASSPELLKSCCGALSNICQNQHNQTLIAAHGGISCIMLALEQHNDQFQLLPFVFDALASLIVGNDANGREVSNAGAIDAILNAVEVHITRGELVKSACHALAILSDMQGQGAKIAAARGTEVVLNALRQHPEHGDLHRVAAVVLLRMLQEASVAQEIAKSGGIALMLAVMREQMGEVETIAACSHILFSITHHSVLRGKNPISIDSQLCGWPEPVEVLSKRSSHRRRQSSSHGRLGARKWGTVASPAVLVQILSKYHNRKDISRTTIRALADLSTYNVTAAALLKAKLLGPLLHIVQVYPHARDVVDGTVTIVKSLSKCCLRDGDVLSLPEFASNISENEDFSVVGRVSATREQVQGLLQCVKARPYDPDLVAFVFASVLNLPDSSTEEMSARKRDLNLSRRAHRNAEPEIMKAIIEWYKIVAEEWTGKMGCQVGAAEDDGSETAEELKSKSGRSGDVSKKGKSKKDRTVEGPLMIFKCSRAIMVCTLVTEKLAKSSAPKIQHFLPDGNTLDAINGVVKVLRSAITEGQRLLKAAETVKTFASDNDASKNIEMGIRGVGSVCPGSREFRQQTTACETVCEALETFRRQHLPGEPGPETEFKREETKDGSSAKESQQAERSRSPPRGTETDLSRPGCADDDPAFQISGTAVKSPLPPMSPPRSTRPRFSTSQGGRRRVSYDSPLKEEKLQGSPSLAQEAGTDSSGFRFSSSEMRETVKAATLGSKRKGSRERSGSMDRIEQAGVHLPLDPLDLAKHLQFHVCPRQCACAPPPHGPAPAHPKDHALRQEIVAQVDARATVLNSATSEERTTKSRAQSVWATVEAAAISAKEAGATPEETLAAAALAAGAKQPFAGLKYDGQHYLEPITPPDPAMVDAHSARDAALEADTLAKSETAPMKLVYCSCSAAGRGIHSRLPVPMPYQILQRSGSPFRHSLTFDSCFESGNLLSAVQRGEDSYDLFLRADLHTTGFMQWFYFAVSNTHPPGHTGPVHVTFRICNLTKPDSLFNQGMRPACYSMLDAREKGIGWVRCGYNIYYRQNQYRRGETGQPSEEGDEEARARMKFSGQDQYYSLSFSMEFSNPGDTVLIAHSYPFTFSDQKRHVASILADPSRKKYVRRSTLCTSLGGHEVDLLTITDFSKVPGGIQMAYASPGEPGAEDGADLAPAYQSGGCPPGENRKRTIVLTGRVHPGETPASWMMRGLLDLLTGESVTAQKLRSMFVFKIVPMLNPDGVVFGNNRCGLSAVDLNRAWKKPSRSLHPTIYYTKAMIRHEHAVREVCAFLDLHGHSRKMNCFMYGCDDKKKPRPTVRVFPKLLSWNRLSGRYVSFKDCSFAVKKGREGTGRVVVAREINIKNSYTLEATFCGADFGPLSNCHFGMQHLMEVGRGLADALLDYYLPNHNSALPSPLVDLALPIPRSASSSGEQQAHDDVDAASSSLANVALKTESASSGYALPEYHKAGDTAQAAAARALVHARGSGLSAVTAVTAEAAAASAPALDEEEDEEAEDLSSESETEAIEAEINRADSPEADSVHTEERASLAGASKDDDGAAGYAMRSEDIIEQEDDNGSTTQSRRMPFPRKPGSGAALHLDLHRRASSDDEILSRFANDSRFETLPESTTDQLDEDSSSGGEVHLSPPRRLRSQTTQAVLENVQSLTSDDRSAASKQIMEKSTLRGGDAKQRNSFSSNLLRSEWVPSTASRKVVSASAKERTLTSARGRNLTGSTKGAVLPSKSRRGRLKSKRLRTRRRSDTAIISRSKDASAAASRKNAVEHFLRCVSEGKNTSGAAPFRNSLESKTKSGQGTPKTVPGAHRDDNSRTDASVLTATRRQSQRQAGSNSGEEIQHPASTVVVSAFSGDESPVDLNVVKLNSAAPRRPGAMLRASRQSLGSLGSVETGRTSPKAALQSSSGDAPPSEESQRVLSASQAMTQVEEALLGGPTKGTREALIAAGWIDNGGRSQLAHDRRALDLGKASASASGDLNPGSEATARWARLGTPTVKFDQQGLVTSNNRGTDTVQSADSFPGGGMFPSMSTSAKASLEEAPKWSSAGSPTSSSPSVTNMGILARTAEAHFFSRS